MDEPCRKVFRRDAVDRWNRTVLGDQIEHFETVLRRNVPGDLSEIDRGAHAPRHRLTVQESAVARLRFEGMSEGVAEVQNAALIVFALVTRNDLRLHAHTLRDDMVDSSGLVIENFACVLA